MNEDHDIANQEDVIKGTAGTLFIGRYFSFIVTINFDLSYLGSLISWCRYGMYAIYQRVVILSDGTHRPYRL